LSSRVQTAGHFAGNDGATSDPGHDLGAPPESFSRRVDLMSWLTVRPGFRPPIASPSWSSSWSIAAARAFFCSADATWTDPWKDHALFLSSLIDTPAEDLAGILAADGSRCCLRE
jgi:hypothetical protein